MGEAENQAEKPANEQPSSSDPPPRAASTKSEAPSAPSTAKPSNSKKKRKKGAAVDAGGGTPRGQRIFQVVALALAVAFVVVGFRYRSKKTQVDPINAPDDDGPRAKCARGDGPSCMKIGDAYAKGEGVPVDLAEARAFFQKACMAHYQPGCERRDALRPQSSSASSGRKPIYRPE